MLDFAKAIHEAIGIESPRLFILLFAFIGLLLFSGLGWVVDHGYRVKLKEQAKLASVVPTTQPAAAPSSAVSSHEPPSGSQPHMPTPKSEPPKPESQKPAAQEPHVKSKTGDINIGPNSPVTNSTVNTGTIITPSLWDIGPDDATKVIDALSRFAGQPVFISTVSTENHPLAFKLREVLERAKWNANMGAAQLMVGTPVVGLLVSTPVSSSGEEAAHELVRVLGVIGLKVPHGLEHDRAKFGNSNAVEIIIGSRP